MAWVYVILNKMNNKHYVGQTVEDIRYRLNRHFSLARKGEGYILHKAIRKYGEDNFRFVEKIECERERLDEIERLTILKYNSIQPNGYNILEYGSIANIEEGWWKGKDRAESTKQKISETKKAQYETLPEEQKEALKEQGRQAHNKYNIKAVCKKRWDSMTEEEKKETIERIDKARLEYLTNETTEQKAERYKKISIANKGKTGFKSGSEALSKAIRINKIRIRSEEERIRRIEALRVPKKHKENYVKAQRARRTPEQVQRVLDIRELLTKGLSGVEIAHRIGCTPEYIYMVKRGERGKGI